MGKCPPPLCPARRTCLPLRPCLPLRTCLPLRGRWQPPSHARRLTERVVRPRVRAAEGGSPYAADRRSPAGATFGRPQSLPRARGRWPEGPDEVPAKRMTERDRGPRVRAAEGGSPYAADRRFPVGEGLAPPVNTGAGRTSGRPMVVPTMQPPFPRRGDSRIARPCLPLWGRCPVRTLGGRGRETRCTGCRGRQPLRRRPSFPRRGGLRSLGMTGLRAAPTTSKPLPRDCGRGFLSPFCASYSCFWALILTPGPMVEAVTQERIYWPLAAAGLALLMALMRAT